MDLIFWDMWISLLSNELRTGFCATSLEEASDWSKTSQVLPDPSHFHTSFLRMFRKPCFTVKKNFFFAEGSHDELWRRFRINCSENFYFSFLSWTWAERKITTRWYNSIHISFLSYQGFFHILFVSLWFYRRLAHTQLWNSCNWLGFKMNSNLCWSELIKHLMTFCDISARLDNFGMLGGPFSFDMVGPILPQNSVNESLLQNQIRNFW